MSDADARGGIMRHYRNQHTKRPGRWLKIDFAKYNKTWSAEDLELERRLRDALGVAMARRAMLIICDVRGEYAVPRNRRRTEPGKKGALERGAGNKERVRLAVLSEPKPYPKSASEMARRIESKSKVNIGDSAIRHHLKALGYPNIK